MIDRKELEQLSKEELIDRLISARNSADYFEKKVHIYEQNGAAKLYYSLNRKSNEMADLLNKNDLTAINIDDPKDKTFDRLKIIWADADGLANAIKTLGSLAGVTGDEDKDTKRKPFVDTIAEKRD
jgi:hypothetical protein